MNRGAKKCSLPGYLPGSLLESALKKWRCTMEQAGNPMTLLFRQREQQRHSMFAEVWKDLIPKVFEDVPRYYRFGNIVASLGLWELWVWQFVRTIKLRPGY